MYCAICTLRISEWMQAQGKITIVEGRECHKSCLIDYSLRKGQDWKPEPAREAGV